MKRDPNAPEPITVHNHLMRYLSERVAIETAQTDEEPTGSESRWLLRWAHKLKPRRSGQ